MRNISTAAAAAEKFFFFFYHCWRARKLFNISRIVFHDLLKRFIAAAATCNMQMQQQQQQQQLQQICINAANRRCNWKCLNSLSVIAISIFRGDFSILQQAGSSCVCNSSSDRNNNNTNVPHCCHGWPHKYLIVPCFGVLLILLL